MSCIGREYGNNTCERYLKIIGTDMRVDKGVFRLQMGQQQRKVGMKAT